MVYSGQKARRPALFGLEPALQQERRDCLKSSFSSARCRLEAAVEQTAAWLEHRAWLSILFIVVVYLPAAFAASDAKPLWHDELFTWYIAQAPTLGALWQQSRNLDLNPPLVFWLTRLSFHLFGTGTLATRLPEIAGFLLFLLATFHFVRRRMGVMFALSAAALLLAGKSLPLAVEARPYTLLLGFLALALAAWQAAGDGRRPVAAPLLLFFAVTAMLLSHIFSVVSARCAACGRGLRSLAAAPPELRHPRRITAAPAVRFHLPSHAARPRRRNLPHGLPARCEHDL